MKTTSFLALAIVLCGCQQETSQPPRSLTASQAEAAAAPSPARDPRPVIACFGDSLTAGLGLDPGESFPDLLQRDLDSHGYRYRVINMGVSGETTHDGLARLGL